MAAASGTWGAPMKAPDHEGIPAFRFREGRQHVLETAFGLLSASPTVMYLMSFIVRMRYCPDTDSCQVVIQPHYRTTEGHDEEVRDGIVTPLSREIRATLGERIPRKTCAYLSASSAMDEDNLADLFILYFFTEDETGGPVGSISGVYQMSMALRTFAPEMEEIAVDALERCLSIIRQGSAGP
jgi:hypothetical protein